MSTETELRRRRPRAQPELDVEQELDVRRLWSRIAPRWWLPLAGLIAGALVGYLIAMGSSDVYRATALVYLGQPIAGGAVVPGPAAHPTQVGEVVRSEAAVREAAQRSGLRRAQLRRDISTKLVLGGGRAIPRAQTLLIEVSVQGETARGVEVATNTLADRLVVRLSPYTDQKIRGFERRLSIVGEALTSIQTRINSLRAAVENSRGLRPLEQLSLISQLDNAEQRRAQLIADQSTTEQLLAQARNLERPGVVERAVAAKTTARNVRNSVLVGALIGLLLGLGAALLWEPVGARVDRSSD